MRTCSSAALPQTPQDEVRWKRALAGGSRRRPARVRTSTTLAARSAAGPTRRDVAGPGDQPLARQEARRQLLVLARRAHRHGERLAVDADLERLLDGQLVARALAASAAHALDPVAARRGVRRRRALRCIVARVGAARTRAARRSAAAPCCSVGGRSLIAARCWRRRAPAAARVREAGSVLPPGQSGFVSAAGPGQRHGLAAPDRPDRRCSSASVQERDARPARRARHEVPARRA